MFPACSTQLSQICPVIPAMRMFTSLFFLPQNEQLISLSLILLLFKRRFQHPAKIRFLSSLDSFQMHIILSQLNFFRLIMTLLPQEKIFSAIASEFPKNKNAPKIERVFQGQKCMLRSEKYVNMIFKGEFYFFFSNTSSIIP